MAALTNVLFIIFTCGLVCTSSGVSDRVTDGVDTCNDTCAKSYAAHTYEHGNEGESCKRGCRFYSIMSLIHDHAENESMTECQNSCLEAYNSTRGNGTSEAGACLTGCQSQRHAERAMQTENNDDEAEDRVHMLYPLMYMHSVYSNMLDNVYHHMEVSWSVFLNSDTGDMVVVRSQPVIRSPPMVLSFVPVDDEMEDALDDTPWPDDRTSSQVETNIAGQDNSATPFFNFALGSSQLKSARGMNDDQGLQLDVKVDDQGRSDWLSCVARKTGIARIVLCFLILATAIVMVWFCLTAAATAPEQHLSINGDLEYLRGLDEKGGYKLLQPQCRVEARPLPIKIKVEQI